MARFIKRKIKKAGLSPGTLIHVGDIKSEIITITIIDYDEINYHEKNVEEIEECFPFKEKPSITWINIDGIHDVNLISEIGKYFGMHELLMEDIVNSEHMPKLEIFENHIYLVLKMLDYDERAREIRSEQISLILGQNYVITFQEKERDIFNPVRERIKNSKGRHRKLGADYLAYSLIDIIVDHYFIVLERIGEKIESLEQVLVTDPNPPILHSIQRLKSDVIFLRKSIWPIRDIISNLKRSDSELIKETTELFLKDVYDHSIQIIDTIEIYRELIAGILDIYLSSVSNKMNEVMKTLTIIATIFIPLTFIVGIYGMNFKYMPELDWHWGYFIILFVMAVIVGGMVYYFMKKKWF